MSTIVNPNWDINKKVNGTFKKTILITEKADILVPFKVKYKFMNDNSVKSVLSFYLKYSEKYNILIDNRLILTISYLTFYVDDLLIYDSSSNKIISFYAFISKHIFNNKIRIFDKNKLNNVFFIYTFIKIRCSKLFVNWKLENCITSVQKFNCIPTTVNIEVILDYLQNSEVGSLKYIQNYIPKDIYDSFFIDDNLKPLELKNKNELLMELIHINKYKSKYVKISDKSKILSPF